jgi:hypothetical protein
MVSTAHARAETDAISAEVSSGSASSDTTSHPVFQADTPQKKKSTKPPKTPKKPTPPKKSVLKEDHIDIIGDTFWESRPWILGE